MNLMLTGATGFVGSYLLKALVADDIRVICPIRSTSSTWRIDAYLKEPKVTLYNIEKYSLFKLMTEEKIEVIVHCATDYGRSGTLISDTLKANLIYPLQLLEAGAKCGVKYFINTDSYYNKFQNFYTHLAAYSKSKRDFQAWATIAFKNISQINVVLEHVYGPLDGEEKFVSRLIDQLVVNKSIYFDATLGEQERDFVYIDDVINGYRKIIHNLKTKNLSGRTFEIGTGTSVKLSNFMQLVKSISKSPTKINLGALPYREGEIMSSRADILSLQLLGWTPKTSLREGVRKTVEFNLGS